MALTFNGSQAVVVSSAGCNFAAPFTIAAIARRGDDNRYCDVVCSHNSSVAFAGWDVGARVGPSRNMYVYTSGTGVETGPVWNQADGWCFLVWKKSSGTTAPVFHKYVYNTGTWTHTTSGSTLANGTAPGSGGFVKFGRYQTDTSGALIGDIAAVGIYNAVLSQDQVMAMAFSLAPWIANGAAGLWMLDAAVAGTRVIDLTGRGGDETSRDGSPTLASTSVPVFNRGHSVIYPTQADLGGGGGSTVNVAPTIDAASGAIIAPRRRRAVSLYIPGALDLSVLASRRRAVEAEVASSSGMVVRIGARRAISAQVASSSGMVVRAGARRPVAPQVVAASTVAVRAGARRPVAAQVAAASTVTITPSVRQPATVAPQITAASSVSITPSRRRAISAQVSASSSVDAAAGARRRIAALVTAASSMAVATSATRRITAQVASASSLQVGAGARRMISAQVAASSTVQVAAGARRLVAAAIAAASSVEITAAKASGVRRVLVGITAASTMAVAVQRRRAVAAQIASASTVQVATQATRRVRVVVVAGSGVVVVAGARRRVGVQVVGASSVEINARLSGAQPPGLVVSGGGIPRLGTDRMGVV